MPGLSGVDLAKEVLKIKPSMPIIMCTGHSETVLEHVAQQFLKLFTHHVLPYERFPCLLFETSLHRYIFLVLW
jgi:DNA-binding LytR/AlgR family response regulator